ncbi:MAG: hypothetical protein AAB867_01420 [Patescibacteria group bacterium]
MPPFFRIWILAGLALGIAAFLAAISFTSLGRNSLSRQEEKTTPGTNSAIPLNAFGETAPVHADVNQQSSEGQAPEEPATPAPQTPSAEPYRAVNELAKGFFEGVFPGAVNPTPILELPPVGAGELRISNDGLANFEEYVKYSIAHAADVFPSGDKQKAILAADGSLISPQEIVSAAIKNNDFSSITTPLLAFKEVLDAKIKLMTSIKIRDEVVSINKTMIGIDKLTIELIDLAVKTADSKNTLSELDGFYKRYEATTNFYHNEFQAKYGRVNYSENQSVFGRALGFLSSVANAQSYGLPFGGAITYVGYTTCSCPAALGDLVTVGPPIGGVFYLSLYVKASPALFLYKSIKTGSLIKGLNIPGLGICLTTGSPCSTLGTYGAIIMAGTSQY